MQRWTRAELDGLGEYGKLISGRDRVIVAGVDVGALSTDTVILDGDNEILAYSIVNTGASSQQAAQRSYAQALALADLAESDVSYVISTGYGRRMVPFADAQVTEITCHARGAHFLFPETHTVIDIGGQDSKVIRVGPSGRVLDFVMNDKCAAGTGRFLEVMAKALEIKLEEMGERSLQAKHPVTISSTCTVFAESEVVSRIAEGRATDDIVAGLHVAIANRISAMLKRVGVQEQTTMSGGVAKNMGVVRAIEEKIGTRLNIYQEPQIVGALGAALISLEKVRPASPR
jgi:predicted CoA-substrate-specific enzyme activase